MKLNLSVACWDYDRTRRLFDGRVEIEGCNANFLSLPVEETFFRALRSNEFDVAELSLSSYTMQLSRGVNAYVALPIYLSKMFRHSAIYLRKDSPIKTAQDLKGKKVGVPEYQLTAPVWVRGILEDEYGVAPHEIRWRTGGVEKPGRHEKVTFQAPQGVEVHSISDSTTLNECLLSGEIDALIAPRAPSSYNHPSRPVRRLFENFEAVEKEYFAKTGIFPIMHVVGVKKELLAEHPWLAMSITKAFTEAKDQAVEELAEVAALKTSLPWLTSEYAESVERMGKDIWSYGVAANKVTLDAFLRYHHKQGLSARPVGLNELFAPSTLESFVI